MAGHHVIRRSDRYWGGLSTDLTIEQTLMRTTKTNGGLTRGRGIDESQCAQWLLALPACSELNAAMQHVTKLAFETSEQHKEISHARQSRDDKDIRSLLDRDTSKTGVHLREALLSKHCNREDF